MDLGGLYRFCKQHSLVRLLGEDEVLEWARVLKGAEIVGLEGN